jgi:membrane fusion protein (multidrug efflux system)
VFLVADFPPRLLPERKTLVTDDLSATTAADLPDMAQTNRDQRRLWLRRFALALLVVTAAIGAWWFLTQRGMVNSDNAYVAADMAQVTPLVAGAVREVKVVDTQAVRPGDVLIILDDADARVELAAAEAALAQARQQYRQALANGTSLSAQVGASDASVRQAEAALAAAAADRAAAADALQRRQALATSGAVSAEELVQTRSALAAADANLNRARATVAAARAATASSQGQLAVNRVITGQGGIDSDPMVAAAGARVDAARLALERTVIRAPIAGVVTQRRVQIGQRLAPGTPVMTIVPVGNVYVDANLKEVQLRNVRIGQPVELVSDLYGSDVVYRGQVVGIGGGTGAAFAIIPAQNATGNWVKVVQRVPVRIAINPQDLAAHPLRVGLSMEASIDTRD